MIKQLSIYIGYAMAIIGFAGIVWRVAVSFQKTEDRTGIIEKKIDKIERSLITKLDVSRVVDSLLQPVIANQDAWGKSYVYHLRRDSTLKLDDFIKIMGGLEFELVQPEPVKSVFGKTKIKIIKLDTVK